MLIFYLTEAIRIFKRSPFATVVTISITSLAVFITTISIFILFVSNQLSDKVVNNIEVRAYLDNTIDSTNIDNIKLQIESKNFISSVKFVSKSQAAAEFRSETGEDFRSVLDSNPLPNSFIIKFLPDKVNEKNFNTYINSISSIKGIEEVVYDYNVVVKILNILRTSKTFIYIFSFLLIGLSIYLVYIHNKIQFENNINLYRTMKLFGSKVSSIKIPLYLNGLLIGTISGILGIFINYIIYLLLTAMINNLKFSIAISGQQFLLPFAIGLILGFLGSVIYSFKISLKIDVNT